MNFMIRTRKQNTAPVAEPETGRPAGTGEEWLGRNRSSKRRLWERLNPRSRGQVRMIAEALALQQTHAQLPEPLRARLSATISEIERLVARTRALLAEGARRTPPRAWRLQPALGGGIISVWLSPISAAPYSWRQLPWRSAPSHTRRVRMRFASRVAGSCMA